MKQIISLVILFFSVGSESIAQESPVVSNQQIFMAEIAKLAENSVPEIIKSSALAVYLPEATDQSLEALRTNLYDSGFKITRDYSNVQQFRVVIDTHNELIRIGRSSYSRSISGTISISVYDSTDILIWSDSKTIDFTDVVDKSSINLLTTDWTPVNFDKIEHRRSDRKILRWIQPVIISGAVATTVALLFSVRSQ